ncbi:MAG: rRNA adenine N-6-methyltransferase family protein [Candidatus Woesearchaeota archaeon]
MEEDELDIIFKRYHFSPDPSMDQHFLNNRDNIMEIITLLEVMPEDIIFEVGAGIGTITKNIPKCKKVYAVEIEPKTFEILKKEVQHLDYVEPILGDAIKVISKINFNKIISSTPFLICEPLMHQLFLREYEKAILLLPKRFSDRIAAKNTKLGLFADAFLRMNFVREILPESFSPAPKARTVLVSVRKREPISIEEALSSELMFQRYLLRELYLQRDKLVKNALREIFIKMLKITKREAGILVSRIPLGRGILNKKIQNLKYENLLRILEEADKLTRAQKPA